MGDKVLVIDDDPIALAGLALSLRRRGRQVIEAKSLRECAKMVPDLPEDVWCAVVDYCLQDGTGTDVLNLLREAGNGCGALLLTGIAPEEAGEQGRCAGFDGFLLKPVDPAELDEEVERVSELGKDRATWGPGYVPRRRREIEELETAAAELRGAFGITQTEHRVLVLVVDHSRQEVAAKLGCKESTVHSHLNSIYRKLGIRGRHEIWRVLRRLRGKKPPG